MWLEMKDWDKEKIERYFDTSKLLKQMNKLTPIKTTNSSVNENSFIGPKRISSRRDEQGHKIPIVRLR